MKKLVLITTLFTYTLCASTRVETAHKSHKKLWIFIGVSVASGVLAGTLANQHRPTQPATVVPNLKRITCSICSGKAQ